MTSTSCCPSFFLSLGIAFTAVRSAWSTSRYSTFCADWRIFRLCCDQTGASGAHAHVRSRRAMRQARNPVARAQADPGHRSQQEGVMSNSPAFIARTRSKTARVSLGTVGASLCARRPLDQDRMISWSGNYNKGEVS